MDLQLPEDIYLRVAGEINAIITRLESLSAGDEVAAARQQALDTFCRIGDDIHGHITALEQSAEWNVFTIAFYGETNAGKSTLVETLRILLDEPAKASSRAAFRALRDQHGITDAQLLALHDALNAIDEQRTQLESRLYALEEQFVMQAHTMRAELPALQQQIDAKAASSWWQRLLRLLQRLPEQRQYTARQQALQELPAHLAAASADFRQQLAACRDARPECARKLGEAQAAVTELAALGDGAIIGTGRSDFTMDTQAYGFSAGATAFALLDVPGIEGSEGKVKDEIWAAVRKAHAVFYVTNKPTAPQQGSGQQDGTLQKIKQHLGAQTEVWTIFNKRITNPVPLKQARLINEGERASLEDLDAKMKQELGEHYQGTVSVSALPAFLAVADCLPPASPHAGGRAKFLDHFSPDDILEKTNLCGLRHLLLHDLVRNHRQKIYRSNFNKANQVVLAARHDVAAILKDSFRPLATQLKRNAIGSGKQVDTAFAALKTRLESQGESAVAGFVNQVRRRMYDAIDNEMSNDDFKQVFSDILKQQQAQLVEHLPQMMAQELRKFQDQIADVLERLQELSAELVNAYGTIEFNGVGASFTLNIKLDNGINVAGLIGALVGGALMFWNPAGWFMLAVGALTVLVGGAKAVMGFFSSDYKKSQQRKAVDTNLSEISANMRRSLRDSLAHALPQLEPKVEELKQALTAPGEQIGQVVDLLEQVGKQLKNISTKIETDGAR